MATDVLPVPNSDYLFKSSIDTGILQEETLDDYQDVLKEDRLDEGFRQAIIQVLIPHKISLIKYALNKEYYESMLPNQNEVSYISPSLLVIAKDLKYRVRDTLIGFT